MRRTLELVAAAALILSTMSCVAWTPRSVRTSPDAVVLDRMPVQGWGIQSCGAGALSTVLQHHRDPLTMKEWDDRLPRTRGGVLSVDMLIAARQRGFDAQLLTGDRALVESELRAGNPVILMLQVIQAPGSSYDFFHYVVVDGLDPQRGLVRVQFGEGKPRWTTVERLESSWNGGGHAAIVIRPMTPQQLQAAIREAVALESSGKVAEALDRYRILAQRHPGDALVWTNTGNAAAQLGQAGEAERAYRRAIEIAPASRDALNNLAWLLYEQQRSEEAEPIARRAVDAKGADAWVAYDTLARILAARGSCDESSATFDRALTTLGENSADARSALEKARLEAAATCRAAASRITALVQ